jgi:cell division protein FtsN
VAARRGKNQARRNGAGRRSGLLWLAAGLALGGLAFGYLHFKDRLGSTPLDGLLPKPDPNATAKPTSSDNALADEPEKPRTKFDFYKLLPEKEVVIPDAELDAAARAETAAAAAARAAAAQSPANDDGKPGESLTLDGNAPPATPSPPANAATPPVAPVAAANGNGAAMPAPSENGPHYVIQAGAFLGSAEAEALKAKIALTGEVARVEIAEINGNTVHRVRMGPYPNAASLAAAKAALAAHGIAAQAVRVK